jgi:CRP-like cAMP-binding protein
MLRSHLLSQQIAQVLTQELQLARRRPRRFSAGAVLVAEGEISTEVLVLTEGQAHIECFPRRAEGNRLIPSALSAGMALMVHRAYDQEGLDPGSLVASRDLALHAVAVQTFREVMHAKAERLDLVLAFLAARLHETRLREAQWMERGVASRVDMALGRMVLEQRSRAQHSERHLSVSHAYLADRCGVTRAHVSRELKRLEQAGLIRKGRNRIEVLGLDALLSP